MNGRSDIARPAARLLSGASAMPTQSDAMKSEIDHLPEAQRRELAQVQRILMNEFSAAIATATKA